MFYAPSILTLTGACDDTNIEQMLDLSDSFPFIEWGILYSHTRAGKEARYPSIRWIDQFIDQRYNRAPENVNFSIHLCGSSVIDFIHQESNMDFLYSWMSSHMRIQLNFSLNKTSITIKQLQEAIRQSEIPIITQHNQYNITILDYPFPDNHHIIFDASGGRGIQPSDWPRPIPEKSMTTYAGGLGPDNIAMEGVAIMKIAAPNYGFDMETKLHTEGKFDLMKCQHVARVVDGFRTLCDEEVLQA